MVSPSLRPRRTVSSSVRSTSFVVASPAPTPPLKNGVPHPPHLRREARLRCLFRVHPCHQDGSQRPPPPQVDESSGQGCPASFFRSLWLHFLVPSLITSLGFQFFNFKFKLQNRKPSLAWSIAHLRL
ncbi:protein MRG1-like [Iris pallida]|uniref:Protein MRG1-like n=1 Tax=Iris pallida TaxID=29817 RepID=A0AAX6IEY7_IRIPA|nr:protein MRG1-like [Iris pallida]